MFFIVGRGRSGTTLMSKMLNMHPGISIAHEGMFLINLYFKYSHKRWDPKTTRSFVHDVFLEDKMDLWGLDKEYLLKKLLNSNGVTYASACSAVYEAVNIEKSQPLLGDKNPHYSLFIPRLMTLFPSAKFIFIVRDYRDNILSFQGVHFDLNNTAALAYRWLSFNKIVYKYMQLHPEKFILIKYEDLLQTAETTLKKICTFLDLNFDSNMLKFYESKKGAASAREWHTKLNEPLEKGNMNKWQEKMFPQDLITAETICADFAERFGYLRSTGEPPRGQGMKPGDNVHVFKLWYGKITAKLLLILEKLYFYIPLKMRILMRNRFRKKWHGRFKDETIDRNNPV